RSGVPSTTWYTWLVSLRASRHASKSSNRLTSPTAILHTQRHTGSPAHRLTVTSSLSLPFNRRRWLGRNIIDHAIHTFYFVDDPGGKTREQLGWSRRPTQS